MNRTRWLVAAGGTALALLLLVLLMQWRPALSSAETLTEQEVRDSIISRYSGEIKDIRQEREKYIVDLRLDTGVYEIQIHAQSGDVLSLERVEAFPSAGEDALPEPSDEGSHPEPSPSLPSEPSQPSMPSESSEPSEPPLLLTEEEAAQRALQHISGEVDDVDLKQIDGTGFYLVEIELEDGREAIVQIHAITGEVMSVSWDD
ncbi:PepSY domain-containing protein [Paenibacillus senegalensis]|uniref:PepSY domain-containing protein n=1 Tax=Paenibacillus senegalensis TaxID=1465766 RepID=UPI00028975A4|nr:PepSY domain-containing protein [Paenibacillus senegalensis]